MYVQCRAFRCRPRLAHDTAAEVGNALSAAAPLAPG
jgi:hypothetical protein